MAKTGQGQFSAQVDAWTAKARNRIINVARQSVQDVVTIMQTPVGKGGNMPVDTGFLRASLEASINNPPSGFKVKSPGKASYTIDESSYSLTINGMQMGDIIYFVYLANYASAQEYGTKFMSGHGFVRLAAQQWQSIVSKNAAKARSSNK